MRRVVTAGRLRRRLAITFALVAAFSTGALAVGTYIAVRNARLDDAADHSLALARTNLVLAGRLLAGSSDMQDVAELRELYGRRPGPETVALVGDTELRSKFGREQISDGLRRLVRNGDLAYERRGIGGTPYFVAGGRPAPSEAELYFFFSEAALHDDLAQLRDILLAGWAIVVLLSAAAGALAARRVLRPVARWPRRSRGRSGRSPRPRRASAGSPPTSRTSCARRSPRSPRRPRCSSSTSTGCRRKRSGPRSCSSPTWAACTAWSRS